MRAHGGYLPQTLETFSNQGAAPGFATYALNLTAYHGKTVRNEVEAKEDSRLSTSFVLDDLKLIIENE
jgi:hypothetical protein